MDTDAISARAAPPLAATSVLGLKAQDTTKRDRVSLDHSFSNLKSRWVQRANTMVYWQDASVRQLAFENRNTAVDRVRDNQYRAKIIGLGSQFESNFAVMNTAHRLVYGLDASRSRYEGLRDGVVPPVGETFPTKAFPDTDYTLLGGFVQDEIAMANTRFLLTPGVRFDHYKLDPKATATFPGAPMASSGQAISPRVGAVFRLLPDGNIANLFAQYARGFRAPTPDQVNKGFVNSVANYRSIANPNLTAETSDTVEAGVRGVGEAGRYSVSAFHGEYMNFIFQQQVSGNFTIANPATFQFVNLNAAKIRGAEARGEFRVTRALTALAGIAYARGDQNANGMKTPLDTIDPLRGIVGARYAEGAFSGGLNWTLMRAKESDRLSSTDFFKSPGFGLFDLTMAYTVNKNVAFSAGFFNIFDNKYYLWADVRGLNDTDRFKEAFTQPGRNFQASVRLQY